MVVKKFIIFDFFGGKMAEVEIKNSHKHVEVKFIKKHKYITADEVVEKIINRTTDPYVEHYNGVNSKEYKRYLSGKIEETERKLEFLKFCKRIAGRKVKEVE